MAQDKGTAETRVIVQEQEQAPTLTLAANANNEIDNEIKNDNVPRVTEVVTLNLSIARGPPKPL